ncbi:MAG: threonine/serine exporter family protein [Eubacteriales bacterium]|nr:threonine/serine exporter family protein [Eubacteriales bacterium]
MSNTLSQREVLDIATSIGFYILKYGGETNRVEDTARRLGLAYEMDEVHVFAISSSIVITMVKDGKSLSETKRVIKQETNLDRVEQFNALSRTICETLPSYDEVQSNIKEIESRSLYPFWISVFAYSLIGGSFAIFFGGGLKECIVSFLVGFILRFVMHVADKLQSPLFFANVAGSAATVILVQLAAYIFPNLNTQTSTISVLMLLVPGVLLTNCIRDFVATDYTAGLSKIVEAIFVASAIALGVGVSVLWR